MRQSGNFVRAVASGYLGATSVLAAATIGCATSNSGTAPTSLFVVMVAAAVGVLALNWPTRRPAPCTMAQA